MPRCPPANGRNCGSSPAAPASNSSSTARASTARPIRPSRPPAAWRCGPRPTASRVSTISESRPFRRTIMQYHLAPLFCRPWTLNGITPRLIESHYEGNYGSALRRLNAITEELEALDPAMTSAEVVSRLTRDEASALNSTLLHELCFASLGGDGRAVPETMAEALARDFGSIDRWRQQFIALAEALAGGSGWVLLTYVPRDGRLINQSGADHGQNIAGGIPILALDMYEHAYHIDFGANASAYVAAFMRNIDWTAVEGRYEDATRVAPPRPLEQKQFTGVPAMTVETGKAMLDSGERLQIIDARPRPYPPRAQDIMAGALC